MKQVLLAAFFTLIFLIPATRAIAAKPVKIFILAGQSNMEGQAVVELEGKDYNEGKVRWRF